MKISDGFLVRGALAGAVATVPMTWAMTSLRKMVGGPVRREPLPPEQITGRVADRAGITLDPREHATATMISHFGYGALCGAIFGAVLRFNSGRWSARMPVKGVVYGLGVWAVSYLGWLPALRLMPKATHDRSERNAIMIAAHLVWGYALSRLIQRDPRLLVREAIAGATDNTISARNAERAFA